MKRIYITTSLILTLIWAGLPQKANGQSTEDILRGPTQLEDILPPAPESASAVKYADVPFTHSLGLAEYQIPIYELKGRRLTIPVSLQYRSGGIRMDEVAGVAGLGWNLEAGGSVTREVVYLPDEYRVGGGTSGTRTYSMPSSSLVSALQTNWHPTSGASLAFLQQVLYNKQDCSPDRYSYSVGGLSGTFIMTPDWEVVQLTGDGCSISYDHANETFTIVGPDGTVYTLGGEGATELGTRKNATRANRWTPMTGESNMDWSAITAWHLSAITSRDGSETASFAYSDAGTWNCDRTIKTVNASYDDSNIPHYPSATSHLRNEHEVLVLNSISLSGARIDFSYTSVPSNNYHVVPSTESNPQNYPKRLSGITVKPDGSTVRKSITVNTQQDATDGRVILAGLDVYGSGSTLIDRWSFTYKRKTSGGYPNRYYQDWYGYYNGPMGIPFDPTEVSFDPEFSQDPDPGVNPDESEDPGSGHVPDPDASEDPFNPDIPGAKPHLAPGQTGPAPTTLCPFDLNASTPSITLVRGLPVASSAAYMMLTQANHDGAVTTWEYEGNTIPVSFNSSGATIQVNGVAVDSISIGVRVKSITTNDKNTPVRTRTFTYSNPCINVLRRFPIMDDYADVSARKKVVGGVITDVIYYSVSLHETPVGDGLTLQGATVVYGSVTEDVTDPSGGSGSVRTVYTYDTSHLHPSAEDREYSTYTGWFPSEWADEYPDNNIGGCFGMIPRHGIQSGYRESVAGRTALLTSRKDYEWTGAAYRLCKEEQTTYQDEISSSVLVGYHVKCLIDPANMSSAAYTETGKDMVHYPVYTKRVFARNPSSVTTINYYAPSPINGVASFDSTTVSYSYKPRASLSIPVRVASERVEEDGWKRKTEYGYVDDTLSTYVWRSTLIGEHALSLPMWKQYSIERGNTVTSTRRLETEYALFDGEWMVSARKEYTDGNLSWSETVQARDYMGNVSQIKERGKPVTSILWSYKGRYPVAILKNATASQMTNALGGQAYVNSYLNKTELLDTDVTRLRNMGYYLPNAHITTMVWYPGIGIYYMADPAGVITRYNYDNAGRLSQIKDAQMHVTESWDYDLLSDSNGRKHATHKVYRDTGGNSFSKDVTWWNTLGMRLLDIECGAGGTGTSADLVTAYEGDFMMNDDVKVWHNFPHTPVLDSGEWVDGAPAAAASHFSDTLAYNLKDYAVSSEGRVLGEALPGHGTAHMTTYGESAWRFWHYPIWNDTGIPGQSFGPGVTYNNKDVCGWGALVARTTTDPDGKITCTVQDRRGRTIMSWNPEEPVPAGVQCPVGPVAADTESRYKTRYVYDEKDRLRAVAGAGIAASDTLDMWRYSYDSLDRLHSKGIPGSVREFYTYDSEDRVLSVSKGDILKEYEYDAFGRVTEVYLTTSSLSHVLIEKHVYDAYSASLNGGNDISTYTALVPTNYQSLIRKVSGQEVYTALAEIGPEGAVTGLAHAISVYDDKLRPVCVLTQYPDNSVHAIETTYNFDGTAYSTHETVTLPEGNGSNGVRTYCYYDSRGRLVRQDDRLEENGLTSLYNTAMLGYDALGRMHNRSSTSGSRAVGCSYTYTLQDWLAKTSWTKDCSALYDETLRYDGGIASDVAPLHSGRIAEREDDWRYTAAGQPRYRTVGYAYDSDRRLSQTKTFYSQTYSVYGSTEEGFSYDARGNLLKKTSKSHAGMGYFNTDTLSYAYSGDRLGMIMRLSGQMIPFTHDSFARMTSDGLSGKQIAYNALDLPRKVTSGSTTLANYSYLADGTRTSAVGSDGSGLTRRGSLTYRTGADGSLSFEGADFDGGRFTAGQVIYHITDHLGSVVGIVRSGSSAPFEYNFFDAYGTRTCNQLDAPFTPAASLRFGFTGKEDQSVELGVPYTDFGARHYSPALTRWLTPDPLSEKYYGISPYAYCNGDPVNLVDLFGLAIWELKSDGSILLVDDTVSETIVNYSDKNGTISSITLSSDGFLVGLKQNSIYDGKVHSSKLDNNESNMSDALTFFFFAADHTDKEWAVHYDDDSIALGTKYSTDNAGSWEDYGLSKVPKVSIHSHPGEYNNKDAEIDSMGGVSKEGRFTGQFFIGYDYDNYVHYDGKAHNYYVYIPCSGRIWQIVKSGKNKGNILDIKTRKR